MMPQCETERLLLRGPQLDEFPLYAKMWADPDVTRFIGGKPLSEEESWAKFLRAFGQWAALGFGFWSVIEKGSGLRVGEAGFVDGRRDIAPSLTGTPECGWALMPEAQGRGLATEAMQAVLAWGEARFGRRRFACIIAPRNVASLRVAAKCGFREATRITYKGDPTIVLYRDP